MFYFYISCTLSFSINNIINIFRRCASSLTEDFFCKSRTVVFSPLGQLEMVWIIPVDENDCPFTLVQCIRLPQPSIANKTGLKTAMEERQIKGIFFSNAHRLNISYYLRLFGNQLDNDNIHYTAPLAQSTSVTRDKNIFLVNFRVKP